MSHILFDFLGSNELSLLTLIVFIDPFRLQISWLRLLELPTSQSSDSVSCGLSISFVLGYLFIMRSFSFLFDQGF